MYFFFVRKSEFIATITGNDIKDEGASKISEALKVNATLTQLDLKSSFSNICI